jgi:hypothetical protein
MSRLAFADFLLGSLPAPTTGSSSTTGCRFRGLASEIRHMLAIIRAWR